MKHFSILCCAHAKDSYDFFKSLMPKKTRDAFGKTRRTLSCLSLAIMDAHSVQNPFEGYKSASLFLPYKDYAEFGSCREQWVIIRRTGKRSNILICAFCFKVIIILLIVPAYVLFCVNEFRNVAGIASLIGFLVQAKFLDSTPFFNVLTVGFRTRKEPLLPFPF